MRVITSPEPHEFTDDKGRDINIFLAGSIEQGTAEEWQNHVIQSFTDLSCTIYNPRRAQWDASWVQSIANPQFKEQVIWELTAIDNVDLVLFYFDPNTKAPISLLELGRVSQHTNKEVFVCCPEPFYRKGNVDIVCELLRITTYPKLQYMVDAARMYVDTLQKAW